MKPTESKHFPYKLLYPLVIGVLLFAKGKTFYSGLYLGEFPVAFAIATVAIVLLCYSLISLISQKIATVTLTVLYFFISIMFASDGLYFAYTSKLLSVTQLGMVGQLDK